jgi:hypothetical protein
LGKGAGANGGEKMTYKCDTCGSFNVKGWAASGYIHVHCNLCDVDHKSKYTVDVQQTAAGVVASCEFKGLVSNVKFWEGVGPKDNFTLNKTWQERLWWQKVLYWKTFTKAVTSDEFFKSVYDDEIAQMEAVK